MQVSIQTDRPPRRQPQPVHLEHSTPKVPVAPLPQLDSQEQQEKQRYIKKLTLKNRELLEDLKRQNEQLSKRIGRQKARSTKSYQKEQNVTKTRGFQSVKKQLTNAYKQVDMYKMVILNMRAKGISNEAQQKIVSLENKIKVQDTQIQELQRQLKILKSIQSQQQKDIKIYENQDVKRRIKELEKEANTFREQLKTYKKTDTKRQQMYRRQHTYQLELQKMVRQQNEEDNKRPEKLQRQDIDMATISETQWKILKNELKEARETHTVYLKKIENLNRQKLKQMKSHQENQLKLKQKQKTQASLQTKVKQLKKLILIRNNRGNKSVDMGTLNNNHSQNSIDFSKVESMLMEKDNVPQSPKPQKNGRGFKKWVIPDAKIVERGRIYPNSIFFSDKTALQQHKKTKITEIRIWTNNEDTPCLLKAQYVDDVGDIIEGQMPQLDMTTLKDHLFETTGGDYLKKIQGSCNNQNQITYLKFSSRYGKTLQVGSKSGSDFTLSGDNSEIMTCMYGGYMQRPKGQGYWICHLGCQLQPSW